MADTGAQSQEGGVTTGKSGGAYALTGFLYQLLASADWITLSGEGVTAETAERITVVLEPEGGGDSAHQSEQNIRIVQCKQGEASGWTAGAIVTEVLPDLLRAPRPADKQVDYELITDGLDKRSSDFRRVQVLLAGGIDAALKAAAAEKLEFRLGNDYKLCASDFLAGAVERCRSAFAPETSTAERLGRIGAILARLSVRSELSQTTMKKVIDERLARVLGDPALVSQARDQVIGRLLDLAAEGNARVSSADLHAGLEKVFPTLRAKAVFEADLAARLRESEVAAGALTLDNARETPPQPFLETPTALMGRSGAGKTFELARAADRARAEGALCLWITAPTSMSALRQEIADRLAAAHGKSSSFNPFALRQALREIGGTTAPYRLCICLDQLANPTLAFELLRDPWWKQQGLQVMAAMPAAAAEDVPAPEGIHSQGVADFSRFEVRSFLTRAGVDWSTLAADVIELIRRPNLARLYAQTWRDTGAFRPESEYELVSRAWESTPPGPPPGWGSAIARLGYNLDRLWQEIEGGQTPDYPWVLGEAKPAFSGKQIVLLEKHGRLRWAGTGLVSLDHDRLLAWGLAEAAFRKLLKSPKREAAIFDRMHSIVHGKLSHGPQGRALGYAPLDLLWMLCGCSEPAAPALAERLLGRIAGHEMRWEPISTVGVRGFTAVVATIAAVGKGRLWDAKGAGSALARMVGSAPSAEQRDAMLHLARDGGRDQRVAAFAFNCVHPDARLFDLALARRDAMWEALHTGLPERPDFGEGDLAVDAAQAMVDAEPHLAEAALKAGPEGRRRTLLIGLLVGQPPSRARASLDRLGQAGLGLDGGEAHTHLPSLARLLPEQASALLTTRAAESRAGFALLADLDPAAARKILLGLDDNRFTDRLPVCDHLLRVHPELNGELAERIAAGRLGRGWLCYSFDLLAGVLAAEVWDAMIAALGRLPSPASEPRLLSVLATAPSSMLIERLGSTGGAALDQKLADFTIKRAIGRAHLGADLEARDSDRLLLRTGRGGLERLAVARLGASMEAERRAGLTGALIGVTDLVSDAVVAYARSQLESDEGKVWADPFHVVAAVDKTAAALLGEQVLELDRQDAPWVAGEVALEIEDEALGLAALEALQRDGSDNLYLELRLLGAFSRDHDRNRLAIKRALYKGDGHERALAAWVAHRTGDVEALRQVVQAVISSTRSTAGAYDAYVITLAADHPELGPEVMARFEREPPSNLLRHVLSGERLPQTWVKSPLFAEPALAAALQFDDTFLNGPREGLERLWGIDGEIALEVFEEGLRRGGRASAGSADEALARAPARATDIILKHLDGLEDEKIVTDLCRALRALEDWHELLAAVRCRLQNEDLAERCVGLLVAGWLADPTLDDEILRVERSDPRSIIQKRANEARLRIERLRFVAWLFDAARRAEQGGARRRLLAQLVEADEALRVTRHRRDPLFVGSLSLSNRERLLVERLWR